MKYFKDREVLYEKFFIISKYCSILNSNVNTIVTDMNNVESNTNSNGSNEAYNINNNTCRNNIVHNSSISDIENRNINISDSENNSIMTNNVMNSLFVINFTDYLINDIAVVNNSLMLLCE